MAQCINIHKRNSLANKGLIGQSPAKRKENLQALGQGETKWHRYGSTEVRKNSKIITLWIIIHQILYNMEQS